MLYSGAKMKKAKKIKVEKAVDKMLEKEELNIGDMIDRIQNLMDMMEEIRKNHRLAGAESNHEKR